MKLNRTLLGQAKTNGFALYLAEDEVRRSPEGKALIHSLFGDGAACVYCGALPKPGRRLSDDHIVAIARGGSDHVWNLITACMPCNGQKNDRPVESFAASEVVRRLSVYQDEMRRLVCEAFAAAEVDDPPQQ